MKDKKIRIAMIAASLGFAMLAGCSSSTPPETSAEKKAVANFDLGKCEALEPSLYRCPGSDKPLCDPDFARNEVQCVKVTKDGVILQQLSQ